MTAFNMQQFVDTLNKHLNLPYEKAAKAIRNMPQETKDRLTVAQINALERQLVNYFKEQQRVVENMLVTVSDEEQAQAWENQQRAATELAALRAINPASHTPLLDALRAGVVLK